MALIEFARGVLNRAIARSTGLSLPAKVPLVPEFGRRPSALLRV